MQTYPQLFGFDTNVYEYFVDQYNLCGYNLTLHYPAPSDYPTLRDTGSLSSTSNQYHSKNVDAMARIKTLLSLYKLNEEDAVDGSVVVDGKKFVKRQISAPAPPPLAPTGVIDPHYQCWVLESLEDYASTYTTPWSKSLCYHNPNRALIFIPTQGVSSLM
jgi:carboxypeptidase D